MNKHVQATFSNQLENHQIAINSLAKRVNRLYDLNNKQQVEIEHLHDILDNSPTCDEEEPPQTAEEYHNATQSANPTPSWDDFKAENLWSGYEQLTSPEDRLNNQAKTIKQLLKERDNKPKPTELTDKESDLLTAMLCFTHLNRQDFYNYVNAHNHHETSRFMEDECDLTLLRHKISY